MLSFLQKLKLTHHITIPVYVNGYSESRGIKSCSHVINYLPWYNNMILQSSRKLGILNRHLNRQFLTYCRSNNKSAGPTIDDIRFDCEKCRTFGHVTSESDRTDSVFAGHVHRTSNFLKVCNMFYTFLLLALLPWTSLYVYVQYFIKHTLFGLHQTFLMSPQDSQSYKIVSPRQTSMSPLM